MADKRIDAAISSDMANAKEDYSVESMSTDAPTGQTETEWQMSEWEQNLGYYKKIPEIRAVIDAKSTWTIGKGLEAQPSTLLVLDTIKGNGKDTFNTILENLARVKEIAGDSFAEIIRNPKNNELLNLKPLDPSTIKIISDSKGLIKRYVQTTKVGDTKTVINFKKEDILHLSRNRVADEMHGVSMINALTEIILMKNEAMQDYRRLLHRNIDPLWIFHLDTDDETEVANFKAKNDKARANGENMYIPQNVVVPELVSVTANSVLNPITWIDSLDNKFYEAAGVPKIILGGSGEFTEASAKIAYLAFQQTIEEEQLFIEEQIGQQLGIEIKLTFPASLENELLSDKKKDGDQSINPSETTAGEGQ